MIGKMTREEALAAGVPLPEGAIGVTLYCGATVLYPEVLPVVRIGEPAPCDIAEGQAVVVEFDRPDATRKRGGSK